MNKTEMAVMLAGLIICLKAFPNHIWLVFAGFALLFLCAINAAAQKKVS